jgi:hypothetical protein
MFTNLIKSKTSNMPQQRVNWRAVSDIVGDLIGAISIFATGYILLLAGHGFGLN